MTIFRPGRRAVLVAATTAAVLVGTASWLDRRSVAAESAQAVTIDNFAFSPTPLTIARGTKVVWTNDDGDVHSVTSTDDPKPFKSPALDSGDSFAYTFDHAGTFHYICSVHPYMQGTVIVK